MENGLHAVMVELAQRVESSLEDLENGQFSTVELAKLSLTNAQRAQRLIDNVVNGTDNAFLMRLEDDFIKPANVELIELVKKDAQSLFAIESQFEVLSLIVFLMSMFPQS